MHKLGTLPPTWDQDERQVGGQAGNLVLGTYSVTWKKHTLEGSRKRSCEVAVVSSIRSSSRLHGVPSQYVYMRRSESTFCARSSQMLGDIDLMMANFACRAAPHYRQIQRSDVQVVGR